MSKNGHNHSTLMPQPATRIARSQDLVYCELEGEAVILNLRDGVYYGLDPVGTSIWEKIQQPITYAALLDALIEEYDIDRPQCEKDVTELLRELEGKGLILFHNSL